MTLYHMPSLNVLPPVRVPVPRDWPGRYGDHYPVEKHLEVGLYEHLKAMSGLNVVSQPQKWIRGVPDIISWRDMDPIGWSVLNVIEVKHSGTADKRALNQLTWYMNQILEEFEASADRWVVNGVLAAPSLRPSIELVPDWFMFQPLIPYRES